jgi:hypothetical protein
MNILSPSSRPKSADNAGDGTYGNLAKAIVFVLAVWLLVDAVGCTDRQGTKAPQVKGATGRKDDHNAAPKFVSMFEPEAAIGACSPDGWRLQRQDREFGPDESRAHNLTGVWGASGSDVFAVGQSSGGVEPGTILHFDGATWSKMESPVRGNLNAIYGFSSNDVWAVGDRAIIHYDGNGWSVPAEWHIGDGGLNSMWGRSTNDIFAVGFKGRVLRYNGREWSATDIGNQDRFFESESRHVRKDWSWNDHVQLTGIWGASSSNLFATGLVEIPRKGPMGVVLHYNGLNWKPVPGEKFMRSPAGVWGTSGTDVFVVGDGIHHFDGRSWHAESAESEEELTVTGPSFPLMGVWGSSSTDVFAVAGTTHRPKGSLLLHYDGTEPWREMSTGVKVALNAVWGAGPKDVFVVGNSGTILHYEGKSCLPVR